MYDFTEHLHNAPHRSSRVKKAPKKYSKKEKYQDFHDNTNTSLVCFIV